MVNSTAIQGVGMRWSKTVSIIYFLAAWVNQRFDALFSDSNLSLHLYSLTNRCAPCFFEPSDFSSTPH